MYQNYVLTDREERREARRKKIKGRREDILGKINMKMLRGRIWDEEE